MPAVPAFWRRTSTGSWGNNRPEPLVATWYPSKSTWERPSSPVTAQPLLSWLRRRNAPSRGGSGEVGTRGRRKQKTLRCTGTEGSPARASSFPASPLPRLMPASCERHYIARVFLVTEEQSSLPERGAAERKGENLAQLLNQEHFDLVANFPRQIFQVRLVLLGQNDLVDSCPYRAEHLLLDASNRKHPATEGDLSSHGNVVTHRPAREGRYHRRRHGDTGGWAILGDRSCRHVDVNVPIEHIIRNLQRCCV